VTFRVLFGVRLRAIGLAPHCMLGRVQGGGRGGRPPTAVERAFARANGFLRGRLAEGVEMKRTPELRFVYEAEITEG
jgi:hypothetical protein